MYNVYMATFEIFLKQFETLDEYEALFQNKKVETYFQGAKNHLRQFIELISGVN